MEKNLKRNIYMYIPEAPEGKCNRINFCSFSALSLWEFVTEALGN